MNKKNTAKEIDLFPLLKLLKARILILVLLLPVKSLLAVNGAVIFGLDGLDSDSSKD